MKKAMQIVLMACLLLTSGYAQAKGKPVPGGDADSQVFRASITGLLTSMQGVPPSIAVGDLYTPPEGNFADPKNVSFTPNGSNEVRFTLNKGVLRSKLTHLTEAQINSCFPDDVYGGSIHLVNGKGNSADLVARAWFRAMNLSGGEVQYSIEFVDSSGQAGWTGDFLPALGGGAIYRSADSWNIKVTSGSSEDVCVSTDYVPDENAMDAALEQVEGCEYPYDNEECP